MSAVRNASYQAATYQAVMDRRFKAAARHSARVRLMRWIIPLVVILALCAIIAASVFNPFRILADLPINMDNVVVSGTRITMEAPRLAGFTPDKRPYEVAAKAATQDLTDPDHVELQDIHAKVTLEDRSRMTLAALEGNFDTKSQLLKLKDNIFLQSSTGYEAKLSSAVVDIAAGNVSSDDPVWVKLLNGTLDANRLRITDRGEVVRFDGGVSMTLMLDTPSPDAAQAPHQTDGAGVD